MKHSHQENSCITVLHSFCCLDKENISKIFAFRQIKEKEQITNFQNQAKTFCGIHCISKKIFDFFCFKQVPTSIIELYKILLEKGEKILSWDIGTSDWVDIGSPEKLEWARKNIHLFT